MKWLLLITLSLYSFIVQSAPCALTNVGEQRGTYILKPLSMKGNLTAEKIENTGNIIECTDLQETTNAIKVHFLTQNALRFKVGSRHYIINFPFEYDGKKIELPGKSSYNLEEMLSAIFHILSHLYQIVLTPQTFFRELLFLCCSKLK